MGIEIYPATEAGTMSCDHCAHCVATRAVSVTFPCAGEADASWELPQDAFDAWRQRYVGIDVLAELWRANAYLVAHEDKRKPPGAMTDYLRRWLERVQLLQAERRPPVKPWTPTAELDATSAYLRGLREAGARPAPTREELEELRNQAKG